MATLNEQIQQIQTARDNMKLALEGKGMSPSKDIRTYAEEINNFSGAKLFETVAEMQQDENPQEGDLAVVYREEIQPVQEESEFDSCIFPNTVVLDEAFTGNIYGRFGAVDSSSGYFDGMVEMSSSSFRFDGWGDKEVRITYTSNDGITYTRTDGGEELQEFGITIKWEGSEGTFNSVIGNFMKIGGNYFDGLYCGKAVLDEQFIYPLNNLHYGETNVEYEISSQPYNITALFKKLINKGITLSRGTLQFYIYEDDLYISATNTCCIYKSDGSIRFNFKYQEEDATIIKYNLTNNTYETITLTHNQGYTMKYSGYTHNCSDLYIPRADIMFYIWYSGDPNEKIYVTTTNIMYGTDKIADNSISLEKLQEEDTYKIIYDFAPTQLNVIADYVYGKTFYGKNGVENGTLNITSNLNSTELKNKTHILNSIWDLSLNTTSLAQMFYYDKSIKFLPNIDFSNVTNFNSFLYGCSNLEHIETIDLSSATDIQNMFNSCNKLKTINIINSSSSIVNCARAFSNCSSLLTVPNIDISGSANITGLFSGCSSLTEIPSSFIAKIQNGTDCTSLFYGCSNLVSIPQFSVSNLGSCEGMFSGCSSLQTIPISGKVNGNRCNSIFANCLSITEIPNNIDFSGIYSFSSAFSGCTNLTTVPVLNCNKCNYQVNIFKDCPNLSNNSLNNILLICKNMTNAGTTGGLYKTLKCIGLTQAQAQICTTLSNYSAFTAAGWTTGY